MKKYNLQNFTKGWIVGDFNPSILNTRQYEVACKKYLQGDTEAEHVHKISTEITVIVSGKVEMNGVIYNQDDIIVIEPNEWTNFKAITDTTTLVIKTPSVQGDKYLRE